MFLLAEEIKSYNGAKGEKDGNPKILSQFSRLYSRLDIRLLLPALLFTPFCVNLLFQRNVNAEAFFLGFSLSLAIYFLYWNKQMQRYDTIAKNPIVRSFSKKVYLQFFLPFILIFILVIVSLPYIIDFLNIQSIYSFLAGTWLFMWGSYFQLIYWEKKNHMKIYIKNENGLQKTYAIGIKEREI
jgi:hypothetical protein